MSQNVIIGLIVTVLVSVLPLIGVHIGSDQLTESIQTICTVAAGVYTLINHQKAVAAAGKPQA